ncbi:helix-turn-helix domain-containing protein [Levilactobacillus namurensis]|uniref:helix-turn-helix domain-containing protein n=1 Tax=Levilactobacillus namurensis TaxID=380393 RepID=UPI00222E1249|nr:helix-turn-helix domain-containing protein [Levilactobacillus namurensis]MCW3779321.1 helix-turn-helix domain-containing protein [Levilactobacillus namurensis]MDT7019870.1 helix-turn-helix domain-containing protein [Levilactobacillus namurensis]WNN65548.1 helix-turn-helix domain-containing protein [Levilactobacillus namurensis]
MSKFNLEFRIKVVTEYLAGTGSTSLAKKYGVSDDSVILGWIHRFERRGIESLKARPITSEYSSQFKADVLNWRKQNQASLPATALDFDLSSSSTIWQWERRFREAGIVGLERKRGNPKIMAKHKQRNRKAAKPQNSAEELKQLK